MTSVEKENPLSFRGILVFLGVNLTLGSLLSAVANMIQLLTVNNGVVIFASVFAISTIYFVRQVRVFQEAQQKKIVEIQKSRQGLQTRLEKVLVAVKTHSTENPRPDRIIAWVAVRKFLATNETIQIKEITEDSVILDKGGGDGLVSSVPCKIA